MEEKRGIRRKEFDVFALFIGPAEPLFARWNDNDNEEPRAPLDSEEEVGHGTIKWRFRRAVSTESVGVGQLARVLVNKLVFRVLL